MFSLGYQQSEADYSLFTKIHGSSFIALLIYVDDIIIASNNITYVSQVKTYLDDRFKIKDLGKLKYFLGFEIASHSIGISLSQRKYALEILEDVGYLGCKPVPFPMDSKLKLSKDATDPLPNASQYCRLIGKLLYLTITRPDLSYTVHTLAQFMAKPCQSHLDAVYRLLWYLKGNPAQALFFPSSFSTRPHVKLILLRIAWLSGLFVGIIPGLSPFIFCPIFCLARTLIFDLLRSPLYLLCFGLFGIKVSLFRKEKEKKASTLFG